MKYKNIPIVFLFFLISSCAFLQKLKNDSELRNLPKKKPKQVMYSITDNTGEYTQAIFSGYKNKKMYVAKTEMYFRGKLEKGALEKSISFSKVESKSKINFLKPHMSRFLVWIDGKKYFSEMEIDYSTRRINVEMKSPEPQWAGKKTVQLPVGNGFFCFYTQILECAKLPGFLAKAKKHNGGKMNFYVIMDAYPYFQELFPDVPAQISFPASLSFDGYVGSNMRLLLQFAGHSQIYLVNKQGQLEKNFWIAQSYSKVKQ